MCTRRTIDPSKVENLCKNIRPLLLTFAQFFRIFAWDFRSTSLLLIRAGIDIFVGLAGMVAQVFQCRTGVPPVGGFQPQSSSSNLLLIQLDWGETPLTGWKPALHKHQFPDLKSDTICYPFVSNMNANYFVVGFLKLLNANPDPRSS
jgi:hypothetical protein